jgi:membrane protein implicated in regulation of membrane protease activity
LLNVVSGWLGSLFGGGSDMNVDAGSDINIDTGADISFDASADISFDVPADISFDVPADISFDVPTDVSFDVPADISFDVPTDVSIDIPTDISFEAAADVSVNSTVDGGGAGGGFIPFNMMCLCLFLVVFGAIGQMTRHFMVSPLFMILLLLGCFFLAGFAYWALYTQVIKRLKQSNSSALGYRDLRGRSAEVTLVIPADSIGTISMRDSTGAPISFRARMDPDLREKLPATIPRGETVIITDVDVANKFCYVSLPFNKFSNNANSNIGG